MPPPSRRLYVCVGPLLQSGGSGPLLATPSLASCRTAGPAAAGLASGARELCSPPSHSPLGSQPSGVSAPKDGALSAAFAESVCLSLLFYLPCLSSARPGCRGAAFRARACGASPLPSRSRCPPPYLRTGGLPAASWLLGSAAACLPAGTTRPAVTSPWPAAVISRPLPPAQTYTAAAGSTARLFLASPHTQELAQSKGFTAPTPLSPLPLFPLLALLMMNALFAVSVCRFRHRTLHQPHTKQKPMPASIRYLLLDCGCHGCGCAPGRLAPSAAVPC